MADARTLLKQARRKAGRSQRSLAALAGVPQSTVGRIEAGALQPRMDTLCRLLRACGQDLELSARLGEGVDRAQIRERLALTPRQRLEDLATAAAAIRQLQARARKRSA